MARNMHIQGFCSKARGNVSAAGFLTEMRSWLTNQKNEEIKEVIPQITPILARVDSREVFPTPALQAIVSILEGHAYTRQVKKAEAAAERATKANGEPGKQKKHLANVYDASGRVILNEKGEGLSSSFAMAQEAERWCKRKLVDYGSEGSYAEAVDTAVILASGPLTVRIERADAMAEILKPKKMATHKVTKHNGTLSNGMKVGQTSMHFSRG